MCSHALRRYAARVCSLQSPGAYIECVLLPIECVLLPIECVLLPVECALTHYADTLQGSAVTNLQARFLKRQCPSVFYYVKFPYADF